MRMSKAMALAVLLGASASDALAQQPPAASPVPLTLPAGSTVRVQTTLAPGSWVKGVLASADSASISLVPEGASPLGANQLRLPAASVARFELKTGTKRQWLIGLGIGAVAGLLGGLLVEVDEVKCQYDADYVCSRGEALAYGALGGGVLGAGIGALVKTDRWTPVALDALASPAPRTSGVTPQIRVLPRGGVALGLAVGF